MTGMNKDSMKDNLNERSLHDILSDEIDRQLKENPPKKPSLEEFKEMAYKRLEENDTAADAKTIVAVDTDSDNRETVWTKIKTCKPLRAACIVVCFAAAFVIGGAIFSAITCDVDADKNPKEEIVTENGVIIEDGGWGSSVGEEDVVVVDDWEQVSDIKEIYTTLLVPEYIPSGYVFKRLTIESTQTGAYTGEYLYTDDKNECLEIEVHIVQEGEISLDMKDILQTVESKEGKIFFQTGGKATIRTKDGVIIIWGNLLEEDIIKIVEKIGA